MIVDDRLAHPDPTRRRLLAAALTATALPLAAQPTAERPLVVATINILADLAAQIGGDAIRVDSVVPLAGDPHTFEPTPSTARLLARAQLVLRNGLGLERWLDRLVGAATASRPVVTVTEGLVPQIVRDAHEAQAPDPHLWMDPNQVHGYVTNIERALAQRFPAHAAGFAARAQALHAQLKQLDRDAQAMVDALPVERRKLVTTHDAFRYFAQRYGLTLVASIWGISTETEPSAKEVARIVQAIRRHRVPAVFVETTFNPRLMQRIAADAGVAVGPPLYGDSLGAAGSGAHTYIGMMRANLRALAIGLGGHKAHNGDLS